MHSAPQALLFFFRLVGSGPVLQGLQVALESIKAGTPADDSSLSTAVLNVQDYA